MKSASLVQAYTALQWICTAETQLVHRDSLETSLQNLSVHDTLLTSVGGGFSNVMVPKTLLLGYYLKCHGSGMLNTFSNNFQNGLLQSNIQEAADTIVKVLLVKIIVFDEVLCFHKSYLLLVIYRIRPYFAKIRILIWKKIQV